MTNAGGPAAAAAIAATIAITNTLALAPDATATHRASRWRPAAVCACWPTATPTAPRPPTRGRRRDAASRRGSRSTSRWSPSPRPSTRRPASRSNGFDVSAGMNSAGAPTAARPRRDRDRRQDHDRSGHWPRRSRSNVTVVASTALAGNRRAVPPLAGNTVTNSTLAGQSRPPPSPTRAPAATPGHQRCGRRGDRNSARHQPHDRPRSPASTLAGSGAVTIAADGRRTPPRRPRQADARPLPAIAGATALAVALNTTAGDRSRRRSPPAAASSPSRPTRKRLHQQRRATGRTTAGAGLGASLALTVAIDSVTALVQAGIDGRRRASRSPRLGAGSNADAAAEPRRRRQHRRPRCC